MNGAELGDRCFSFSGCGGRYQIEQALKSKPTLLSHHFLFCSVTETAPRTRIGCRGSRRPETARDRRVPLVLGEHPRCLRRIERYSQRRRNSERAAMSAANRRLKAWPRRADRSVGLCLIHARPLAEPGDHLHGTHSGRKNARSSARRQLHPSPPGCAVSSARHSGRGSVNAISPFRRRCPLESQGSFPSGFQCRAESTNNPRNKVESCSSLVERFSPNKIRALKSPNRGKTSNVQHQTSNAEVNEDSRCHSMFDARCSMLDVPVGFMEVG